MQTVSKRICAITLALLVGAAHGGQSLDQVLDLARSKAYRSNRVDWGKVEREARVVEENRGEDAAIRFVIASLADRHTFYKAPAPSSSSSVPSAAPQVPVLIAEVLPLAGSFPVIRINGWTGKDPSQATRVVRSALGKALEGRSCGLILDFSGNSGGNMWPMLIGLSPLLSAGRLGTFRGADGTASRIEKNGKLITLGGKPHYLNSSPAEVPVERAPEIAILLGSRSASSGEITPLMFHGQKNVRYFGQRTSGFTSANQVFPLANGGTLILTTSMTEDRNGRQYPEGIDPDVVSQQPLDDATEWLRGQCRSE